MAENKKISVSDFFEKGRKFIIFALKFRQRYIKICISDAKNFNAEKNIFQKNCPAVITVHPDNVTTFTADPMKISWHLRDAVCECLCKLIVELPFASF